MENGNDESESNNPELAKPTSNAAATAATVGDRAESGPQHGVRGGTGASELDRGSATRPASATRYVETSVGTLSYLELAPLLADRIFAVEQSIGNDGYAAAATDEYLILKLHGDICADLIPAIGGRWRQKDVQVGAHRPPPYHRVPELMREYARDLAVRIADSKSGDEARMLETLAFAEGRLLSIHPFEDFNGRLTRVFLSEVLRRMELPAVDPTPDPGPPTQRYLSALAAADGHNWKPLMTIWRERMEADNFFRDSFLALTGHAPMPWQSRLFHTHFLHGDLPDSVNIPTGLGKTAVMAVWLIALGWQLRYTHTSRLPRRLVYVVDRRAVVDQSTDFAENLRERLSGPDAAELNAALGFEGQRKLPISTLRGQFVDNREWLEDPARPAIIVGTVDMIGSRLLFEGYGVSRKMRPYHAGLLGADALVLLDEAHLVPPFEALLASIAGEPTTYGARAEEDREHVPAFRLLPLSATSRSPGSNVFSLEGDDYSNLDDEGAKLTRKRLDAAKRLRIEAADPKNLPKALADQAWELADKGREAIRCLIYCDKRDDAQKVHDDLLARLARLTKSETKRPTGRTTEHHAAHVSAIAGQRIELFVGARRVHERNTAKARLKELGFLADSKAERNSACFLVATSAGEVGVDLDADHLVCDLVPWERLVQRFGRVNRRGEHGAHVVVVDTGEPVPKKAEKPTAEELQRILIYQSVKEVIRLLPVIEAGVFDASPGSARDLAARSLTEKQMGDLISAASSAAPLRPALSRPLVDAWSMTSLEEHTGRPRIEPWLRGWVSDEPQTTVAWRAHLPVRGAATATPYEIKAFFEAAPLHASEFLETETYRVQDWLIQRVKSLSAPAAKPIQTDNEEEEDEGVTDSVEATDTQATSVDALEGNDLPESLTPPADADLLSNPARVRLRGDEVIGMIFSASGDYERSLRVQDILFVSQKADNRQIKKQVDKAEKQFRKDLCGATLIVSARIGGLENGLLKKKDAEERPADAADADLSWGADGNGNPLIPFRIRLGDIPSTDAQSNQKWRASLRFDLESDANGEATRWLIVEEWPNSANTEERRSCGPDQSLTEHQSWAERCARDIGKRVGLSAVYIEMLAIAARLHDEGKQTKNWQDAFRARRDGRPYAKISTKGRPAFELLSGYRHEFGSLPHAQKDEVFNKLPADLRDLALHLIAAHHGHARPLISIAGCDDAPPSALEERAREVALRFARLQRRWGPWGLAWWESLLRAADQQASRENEVRGHKLSKETGQ